MDCWPPIQAWESLLRQEVSNSIDFILILIYIGWRICQGSCHFASEFSVEALSASCDFMNLWFCFLNELIDHLLRSEFFLSWSWTRSQSSYTSTSKGDSLYMAPKTVIRAYFKSQIWTIFTSRGQMTGGFRRIALLLIRLRWENLIEFPIEHSD